MLLASLNMCMCMCMLLTKVISLSDEAYRTLKKMKRDGESFSDVIIRMARTTKTRPLTDFAGNDLDDVFKDMRNSRQINKTIDPSQKSLSWQYLVLKSKQLYITKY